MQNKKIKVLYLFAGERKETIEKWRNGEMPDSYLIGLNHMSNQDIEADYIETRLINRLRKINFNLANLLLLFKIRQYDIVFCGGSLLLPLIAKIFLRFKKPKFVWYNTFFTNSLKRNKNTIRGWILKKTILSLDGIICPSTAQRDFLLNIGCNPDRVFYVPNGVDVPFIESNEEKVEGTSEPFILSVGKDMGRDYKTLIEAVRGLPIQVKIVAYPRNIENLKNIPGNVSVEAVSFDNLLKLYKNASIVVIPTKSESWLNASDCSGQYVLLDSMASGKAIIASERATLRDYISDDIDAKIVQAEDPVKLREAIIGLLENKDLMARLGINARDRAQKMFTTKIMADNLASVFKSVYKEGAFT